jgi:hypothetical protein
MINNFFGLNLRSSFKEMASPLIKIIFDIVNAQPTYSFQIDWHVPVTFCKIVQGLIFVLLSGTEGSQPGQKTAVRISLAGQNLVPFHRLFRISHQFVDIRDLINHFWNVGNYGLQFLEGLKSFHEHV